jgi:hypothetical protein
MTDNELRNKLAEEYDLDHAEHLDDLEKIAFCKGWDEATSHLEQKMLKMREAVAEYPDLVDRALLERDRLQNEIIKINELRAKDFSNAAEQFHKLEQERDELRQIAEELYDACLNVARDNTGEAFNKAIQICKNYRNKFER